MHFWPLPAGFHEWKNFKRLFYRIENNIGKACFFENNGLIEGNPNLGLSIFGQGYHTLIDGNAKRIKIMDICVGGRIKDKIIVERILNAKISFVQYFRMRNFILEITRLYGEINEKGDCLDTYFRSNQKKGAS